MRWKGIIAFSIIVIILVIFAFFFADNLVKGTLESLGSGVVGAKVEIGRFEASFFKLLLRVNSLQIANPNDEWQNMIEIKDMRFKMDWSALLQKKIVINEMAIDCILRNTKRTISGKLPADMPENPKPPKQDFSGEQKSLNDELKNMPVIQMTKGEKKANVDDIVNADKLSALTEIKNINNDLDTKNNSAQTSMENLKVFERLNEIKKDIDGIDLSEKNPAKLAREFKKLKDIKNDIDELKDNLTKTDKGIQMNFDGIANSIKRIDQVKVQDCANIVNSLSNVNDLKKEDISRLLFGPIWLDRINGFLYWFDLVKGLLPMPSIEKKPEFDRKFRGIDVEFPKYNSYPGFLLKTASLSTGFSNNPDELKFQGKIEGITSNPALYGKPAIISLKGTKPDFVLEAIFDHTKSIGNDSAKFAINNIDIKGFSLAKSLSFLPAKISQGMADITATITSEGNRIELDMNIMPKGVVFASEDIPADDVAKEIAQVISSALDLKIEAKIFIEKSRISFKITSSIDQIISDCFKKIANARLEETKQEVKKKIDGLVDNQRDELLKNFQSKKGAIDSLIKNKTSDIAESIQYLKAKTDK
jgi:uncharacterized protein (TIGR03545 family)